MRLDLETMHIHELMDSRISTVSANDYAAEALRVMASRNMKWSFVIDRNQVVGIVQAKDLSRLSEALLKERDVREYINTSLVTVNIETDLSEAERLLRRSGHRFLGILKNNLPVGVLTQDAMFREGLTSMALAQPSRQRLAC
jgi:predicted transcriptional regulator